VGLGNPGREYRHTRHNAGFEVLDEIARRLRIRVWGFKYQGRTGSGKYQGQHLFLLKPRTYMNLSGAAVTAAMKALKVPPERLIVIHDDMDLDLGRIKVRKTGGDAGHKGIRSIIERMGTADFVRVRVGIGRPGPEDDAVDYVLATFSPEERAEFEKAVDNGARAALVTVSEGVDAAMNKFNVKQGGKN
jgi:PTH1 family peptidyl-tRNA hydrolase